MWASACNDANRTALRGRSPDRTVLEDARAVTLSLALVCRGRIVVRQRWRRRRRRHACLRQSLKLGDEPSVLSLEGDHTPVRRGRQRSMYARLLMRPGVCTHFAVLVDASSLERTSFRTSCEE